MRLKNKSYKIYNKYFGKRIKASYNKYIIIGIMCGYNERRNTCIIKSITGWPYFAKDNDDIINYTYQDHYNGRYIYIDVNAKIEVL